MRGSSKLLGVATGVAALAMLTAGGGRTVAGGQAADPALIERGRYITHDVAMCIQCHTPRDASGELDDTRPFQGATIPLESPFPGRPWAAYAPAIAGTGHLTDEDLMSVLTTGRRTTGSAPMPPMPPFRMAEQDAAAVVAYLRSLPAR